MAQIIALHRRPADPERYLDYYHTQHVPLIRKLPGLLTCELSTGPVTSLSGTAERFLVCTMAFADMAAVQAALESSAGAAAATDMSNFAKEGDIEILLFEDRPL